MEQNALGEFINQLLDEKQLSGVTDDVREQLVEDLSEKLLDQINRAVIDEFSDTQVDEFNALLDTPDVDDQKIQTFIASSGVNVQTVAGRTMLRFRELYLGKPTE